MHISEFDYELPPELIAREPVRPRDASRMMILDRKTGSRRDSTFRELPALLNPTDVLVLNNTRVIPARVQGRLERGGGTTRDVEVLFASPAEGGAWEVMCRPGKRIRKGDRIVFAGGELEGTFGDATDLGLRYLHLTPDRSGKGTDPVVPFLNAHGHVPLPPYIERGDTSADAVEYQTIFAQTPGAVAAPTAGLHFTEEVFAALRDREIEVVTLTLHVGVGTFIPVRTDNPREHMLKPERFELSEKSAARLNTARDEGRRIIAVGTTSTRTLEHVMKKHGRFVPGIGEADLYILPGHEFRAVGGLVTNFHLPKSTLLMLVSAFASRENIFSAYRHAIDERYRFYSYGDCMFIH
jgi:S-adenosylmethionine:tRNA ribosyltransferase-isomerase